MSGSVFRLSVMALERALYPSSETAASISFMSSGSSSAAFLWYSHRSPVCCAYMAISMGGR